MTNSNTCKIYLVKKMVKNNKILHFVLAILVYITIEKTKEIVYTIFIVSQERCLTVMQSNACRMLNVESTDSSALSARVAGIVSTNDNYADTAYAVSFFAYAYYSYCTYRFYLNQFHMPRKTKTSYAAMSA